MQKFRGLRVAIGVAVLSAFSAVPGGAAPEPASLIVIVDGSGSMGGFLEGGGRQSKLAIVREALRPALALKVAPQTRVGLATFGHRGKGCADVEVIRAPEPLDVERIMTPLDQIIPRGRGPLTLALREAAKGLPRGSRPRALLLIHDDADNCRLDLCAAASELSTAGITAHVVSIGAKADDIAKMACLPQATGGRHFKAQNAEQVAAFIGEALRLGGSELAAAIDLVPAAPLAGAIAAPAPIPASGPAALYLRALLAPNTEPLSLPLHWMVASEGQGEEVLFDAWAANPVVPVMAGRYVVEVRNELVSARQSVIVRENRPIAVPVVLGAGAMRVRAIAQRTNALLADTTITISSAAGAADARGGPPIAVFRTGDAVALLPAGHYIVRAELGLVRAERTVSVSAGRPLVVDIHLNAGRLQLTTGARDGVMPLEAAIFSIMEDDPPRGRREVARSAARQAEFVLPPGTYYIVARQGSVEARERLEIGPGDIVKRTLTAPAGRLSLSFGGLGLGASPGDLASYTITRLDDPTQDIVTTSRPAPSLLLPSGRYRIEGRYGLTNVRTVRDIDIKAGQMLPLSIDLQAAALRLRFVDAGAATKEVAWEIRDEAGGVVWTSGQAEAAATLQAGRYLVAAESRGKRYDRTVELRAGDAKLVQIQGD